LKGVYLPANIWAIKIENHAEDIKLSTLLKVTKALGKRLSIKIM
jgi:hypothetical protein